ncbi:MAG: YHYH domain-containing protein [Rhodoferax sp.]|nr:YHYH domain-containing protein [Rhodoferax sp.]
MAQATAWTHSGRTDKNGCHRDVKAGTRHCH